MKTVLLVLFILAGSVAAEYDPMDRIEANESYSTLVDSAVLGIRGASPYLPQIMMAGFMLIVVFIALATAFFVIQHYKRNGGHP